MKRIILLVGFALGVAGSWFVPAHATPNNIVETDYLDVHVVGITLLHEGPSSTVTGCGNAVRKPICDAIAGHSPQTIGVSVNTGDPSTGATVSLGWSTN